MDGEAPVFRISHHLFWTGSQDPGVRLAEMEVRERKLSQEMATSGLPKSKLCVAGQRGLTSYYMTLPVWLIYMHVILCSRCLRAQISLVPSKGSLLWGGGSKEGGSASMRSPGILQGPTHPASHHICLSTLILHCSSMIRFGCIYSAS